VCLVMHIIWGPCDAYNMGALCRARPVADPVGSKHAGGFAAVPALVVDTGERQAAAVMHIMGLVLHIV